MDTQNIDKNSEVQGRLPDVHGSPSSDLGYDAELTTAQLHAQWVAKYEQVQELWNIDNCQKNDRIEELETHLAACHKALMVCDGAMIGKVKPSSVAFKMIGAILRPENDKLRHSAPAEDSNNTKNV